MAWNRNNFDNWTVYLSKTEVFKIELIIRIKIDLALNNLQRLICHRNQPTNQPINQPRKLKHTILLFYLHMRFNKKRNFFMLKRGSLKLINKFTYFGSNEFENVNQLSQMFPVIIMYLLKMISICDLRKHEMQSIIYWSYGSETYSVKWNAFFQTAVVSALLLLYFGLRPGQKCYSKVMHRKEVTHSNGSYGRKSRGRKLADEMGRGKKNPMVHW